MMSQVSKVGFLLISNEVIGTAADAPALLLAAYFFNVRVEISVDVDILQTRSGKIGRADQYLMIAFPAAIVPVSSAFCYRLPRF